MKFELFFVGGGSGGHVIPAKTLIEELRAQPEVAISYVGDRNSIEYQLMKELVPFYPIKTGKLRRYFSWENFTDLFKIAAGFLQSLGILFFKSRRHTLIFSTGGFVSVPFVLAGRVLGFRIFIHEQTSRVGLANKICSRLARKVFISFEASRNYFPAQKVVFSGYPVRREMFSNLAGLPKPQGLDLEAATKPIVFVTGGGNGSLQLNEAVKRQLTELTAKYLVLHQVGAKFLTEYARFDSASYRAFDFVKEEMPYLLRRADVVISRAGAGTVCELLAIQKRSVFVPLKIAQKNEQFHNATEAKNKLGSVILTEDELKSVNLLELIETFTRAVPPAHEHVKNTSALEAGPPAKFSKGREFLLQQILDGLQA